VVVVVVVSEEFVDEAIERNPSDGMKEERDTRRRFEELARRKWRIELLLRWRGKPQEFEVRKLDRDEILFLELYQIISIESNTLLRKN